MCGFCGPQFVINMDNGHDNSVGIRETYFLKTFIQTSEKRHGIRTRRHSLNELLEQQEITQDQYDKVLVNYT